jgi:hypothetical protein
VCIVWYIITDISEKSAASSFTAKKILFCPEEITPCIRLNVITSQKTILFFIFTDGRITNLAF